MIIDFEKDGENMKKLIGLFMGLVLIINCLPFVVFADETIGISAIDNTMEFAGGDGSIGNPFRVSTPVHLNNVSKHLTSSFVQINDIDMFSFDFEPIGTYQDYFTGIYNGNGFAIKNVYSTVNSTEDTSTAINGLFGYNSGIIKNIRLLNSTFNCNYNFSAEANVLKMNAGSWNGGFAAYNEGTIDSCYLDKTTISIYADIRVPENSTSTSFQSYAGGITAWNKGVIKNCGISDSSITKVNTSDSNYSKYTENHMIYIGGISGCNTGGVIQNSYSAAEISGFASVGDILYPTVMDGRSFYVGGICGMLSNSKNGISSITNCYTVSKLNVSTNSDAAVYIGGAFGNFIGDISCIYWSKDVEQIRNWNVLSYANKKGVGTGNDATTNLSLSAMQKSSFVSLLNDNTSNSMWALSNINGNMPVHQHELWVFTNTLPGECHEVKNITLTPSIQGAEVRYTVDGSEPTSQSILYTGSIEVYKTTLIRSVVIFDNKMSPISTFEYSFPNINVSASVPSGVYNSVMSVVLSANINGYDIYYTLDGADPTRESTKYTTPITVYNTTELKCFATKNGINSSVVAYRYEYDLSTLAVTANIISGEYNSVQSIKLTSKLQGYRIHYTLDGSTPTVESPIYSNTMIKVFQTTTLKAVAIMGDISSDVVTYVYTFPEYNIEPSTWRNEAMPSGTYDNPFPLWLTPNILGVDIYYTTNGDYPTIYSNKYDSSKIDISRTTTINAAISVDGNILQVFTFEYVLRLKLDDGTFLEGTGTASDPYLINNEKELRGIEKNLESHFKITRRIELTKAWTPVGTSDKPFKGSIDGGGHHITNIYFTTKNNSMKYVGFIGYNYGSISNLFIDTSLDSDPIGGSSTGILAGRNIGTIENCHIKGTINYTSSGSIGGLVGSSTGKIMKSSANVLINTSYNGSAEIYTGGLVGSGSGPNFYISDSYAIVTFVNPYPGIYSREVGGLIGQYWGVDNGKAIPKIVRCFADVTCHKETVGGLVGYLHIVTEADPYSGRAYSSYFNIEDCYAKISSADETDIGDACLVRHMYTRCAHNIDSVMITIKNSYVFRNTNDIILAGLVREPGHSSAQNTKQLTVSSSYYNITPGSTVLKSYYGQALKYAEIREKRSFLDWNFDTVWDISPYKNNGMPYLRSIGNPIDANAMYIISNTLTKTGGTLSGDIEMLFVNNKEIDTSATVVVSIYSDDKLDRIIDMKNVSIALGENTICLEDIYCLGFQQDKKYKIKIFLWNDTKAIRPICESLEIES